MIPKFCRKQEFMNYPIVDNYKYLGSIISFNTQEVKQKAKNKVK